ncbi:MAG: hypothetical protein JWO04_1509 [Gammaproteobacteria bacterium]|jgi:hypothetical protein|nr:hypothetical protein [Gammaproteobacteria bacterium]
MVMEAAFSAWINAEWTAGRLTRPSVALTQLQANLKQFLSKYPIQGIFDPPASGVTNACIMNNIAGQRPGSILRTHNMHATETFRIQSGYGASGEGLMFPVHGLFTTAASAAKQWYTLDATGPALLLTAKLTGCTFIARAGAVAGEVDVAHVQPDAHIDGVTLNNTEAGVAAQHCYGRNSYNIDTRSINVIGIRSAAGVWKIYAQKIEKHALSIRSVTKVYP